MPETEKPQTLSDEERTGRLREPHEMNTEKFSEIQRQWLIDHDYGDPDLWTKEDDKRNFGEPVSNADLPAMIKERGKRWGRWNLDN